jgi:O-antigen ligase
MAKSKRNKAEIKVAGIDDDSPPWATWLTQIAFVLAVGIAIARAMMSETARQAFDAVPGALPAPPRSPGATTSLVLDALCWLPALLVLLRLLIDRQYIVRWTWSQLFFGGLALWAACSVAWASDKFLSLIAASHTIAAAMLIWSVAQLVRSWVRFRIVAGICLGLLLIYSAQGLVFKFIDVPENIKYWNEHKDEELRQRGWEPGSFSARQFERKLTGGEMIGFNTSPNSFAAVLVLLTIVSIGVAIQRSSDDRSAMIPIVATVLIILPPAMLVLYFTHARTAAGTIFLSVCALLYLAGERRRAWLSANAKFAYFVIVVIVLLGAAALIGHGVYHGSLPQDSLNFRWRYWSAASRLFARHPLAGVGWGNFGEHYLAVRWPIAAEEIQDPHNFVVRSFAELGLIGGLLCLTWIARAGWELTRPIVPKESTGGTAAGGRGALMLGASAIVLGVVINCAASIDFAQDSSYVFFEVFRRLMALGLLFVALIATTVRSLKDQSIDDRPAPWLLAATLIALGAFFVHNLIDFVIAEPGPLILFAVVLGAALGVRTPSAAGSTRRSNAHIGGILGAGVLAWVVAITAIVIPIADAEQRADDADDAIRHGRVDEAAKTLAAAAKEVRCNADYAYRSATAMIQASAPAEQVKAMLEMAIAEDPAGVVYYLTRAGFERRLPQPDPAAIRADYDRALRLDPQNIPARIDYAEALTKLGDPSAAAEQYRLALATNDQYHPDEPKRLDPERVRQIKETIAQLAHAAGTATTTPS